MEGRMEEMKCGGAYPSWIVEPQKKKKKKRKMINPVHIE